MYVLVGVIVIVLVVVSSLYIIHSISRSEKTILKIFSAGSLSLVLKEVERVYEDTNTNIDIQLEFSGSILAVKKIVELHRSADVLFSADYNLIVEYMMDKGYADWTIVFASNELVLAYTDKSRYADMINSSNWYEILLRNNVKYGFSNPNADPCGYRALTILYMASIYYNDTRIWDELILKHVKNIMVKEENGYHTIYYPAEPDYVPGKLVIRDKSVDLISLLEAGQIDYAFEYRSVAVEHGLKYIELPHEINLAEKPFINVTIILYHGEKDLEKPVSIGAIKYGLTIPSTSKHPDKAIEFLEWLLYGDGRGILEKHGFRIIKYEFIGNVPSKLKK